MPLQIPELANDAFATLAGAVLATDTVVTVSPNLGARFPVPLAPRIVRATLIDVTDSNYDRFEHVDLVALAGSPDAFTMVRGVANSLPRPFPASAILTARPSQHALDALLGLPTASRTFTAQVFDALNAEDVVNIGADGFARPIATAIGAVQNFSGINVPAYICGAALDSQRVVICYQDTTLSLGRAVVATITGGADEGTGGGVSFGQPVTWSGANNVAYVSCCALDAGRVLVFYLDSTAAQLKAVVLQVSGTVLSVPTAAVAANAVPVTGTGCDCANLDGLRVFLAYQTGTTTLNGSILSVSGTVLTAGALAVLSADTCIQAKVAAVDQNRALVAYTDSTGTKPFVVACTVASVTITAGTPVQLAAATGSCCRPVVLDPARAVVAYQLASTFFAVVVKLQGTVCTLGTALALNGATPAAFAFSLARAGPASNQLVLQALGLAWPITVSGTTLIEGTSTSVSGGDAVAYDFAVWLDSGIVAALYQDTTQTPAVGYLLPLPCGDLCAQVDAISQAGVPNGVAGLFDFRGELHLSSGRTPGERYWPGDTTGLTLNRRYYPNPAWAGDPLILGDVPAAFAPTVDLLKLTGSYVPP